MTGRFQRWLLGSPWWVGAAVGSTAGLVVLALMWLLAPAVGLSDARSLIVIVGPVSVVQTLVTAWWWRRRLGTWRKDWSLTPDEAAGVELALRGRTEPSAVPRVREATRAAARSRVRMLRRQRRTTLVLAAAAVVGSLVGAFLDSLAWLWVTVLFAALGTVAEIGLARGRRLVDRLAAGD